MAKFLSHAKSTCRGNNGSTTQCSHPLGPLEISRGVTPFVDGLQWNIRKSYGGFGGTPMTFGILENLPNDTS